MHGGVSNVDYGMHDKLDAQAKKLQKSDSIVFTHAWLQQNTQLTACEGVFHLNRIVA